jgi:hypothetical protein
MRAVAGLLLVAGCTAVYDAQYDDRAKELEEARVEVVSADNRPSAITASDHRMYWVDNVKPLDQTLLHSIDKAGTRVDYEFTRGLSDILTKFQVSDTLVVHCNFGTVTAFLATAGNQMIDMTSMGSDQCSVNGGDVYFVSARKITRWRPGSGNPPAQVVDMDAAGIGTAGIGGFGAFSATQMLLEEGGKLWLVDLTAGSAVWLENRDDASGAVVFDERSVMFETNRHSDTPEVLLYADHSISFITDKIADGGYDLNFEHADVQKMSTSPAQVWLVNHVLFYRSLHGIFAYRFDTGKVIDVLLDRGESFDAVPRYGAPVVTLDNVLYTLDNNSASGTSDKHPIYKVDLSDRLK